MKKQSLLKLAALLLLCCVMVGCGKEEPQPANQTTTIYGTVFNSITHEPVIGAVVEFGKNESSMVNHHFACQVISSSVSGNDGQFELQFGQLFEDDYGHYYIWVSSDGYEEYYSIVNVGQGGAFRVDINLDPQ